MKQRNERGEEWDGRVTALELLAMAIIGLSFWVIAMYGAMVLIGY